MKSRWVEHNGKRVFIAEYSNFGMDTQGLLVESKEILDELAKYPPQSVMVVTNVEGTVATPATIAALRNMLPLSNKYVIKRAVVGVGGVRLSFLELFNRITGSAHLNPFETMEQALDWIVKD